MAEERLNVYQHVARFKNKYPLTIGWRYRKNASIVEKHLNPGEYVVYAFIAQKNNNFFPIEHILLVLFVFVVIKSNNAVQCINY